MATKYYSLNYFRLYDPSGEGGAAEPGGNEVSVFPLTFTFDTSRSKLEVRLDEVVLAEGYTYDPETKTVIFDEPPQGNYLLIRRVTDLSTRDVVFTARSMLSEVEQNRSALQLFDALQEAADLATWLKEGEYDIDAIGTLVEIRDKLLADLADLRAELEEIDSNVGRTIAGLLDRLSNLLISVGDLEDLIERAENLDVDCLMPPVSNITPENSGHPVVAAYPMGGMDSAHRVVLEFNQEGNLFYNNGPALVYGGQGGKFLNLGWAQSPGCLKIDSEEDAIEFKIDESSFGSMNRSASVNAEDYLTVSFRCRFNGVLPSDRRRALVEVWSDNSVDWGLREDFGRNLLTMAWNSPGLLQIELWNQNTGPGVVWANARLTGIFDGDWHLLEWRIRPGDRFTSTSLPGQALWLDGTYIPPTYYVYPAWRISSYGDLRIGLGKGYHWYANEAQTNDHNGTSPLATFEGWCPGRFDELTISTIRRHENGEDYEPSSGPLVGGGAGYVISSQPLGVVPAKVTGAADTDSLTCKVTSMKQSGSGGGRFDVTGRPYLACYHIRSGDPENVFALHRPYCVLGFGSEDCTKLAWQEVTPTVSFDVYSLLYNKGADVDRSYEICGGSVWSHTKGQTGYRWNTRWNVGISSSSYYYGLKENWGHPPLRVECLLPDEVIHSGFITGEMRHGASYGKHLRGWRLGGQEFIFIPQMTTGSRNRKDNSSGKRSCMISLWFRPAVDGPTGQRQTLYFQRNMESIFYLYLLGSEVYCNIAGNVDGALGSSTFVTAEISAPGGNLYDGNWHHFMILADEGRNRYSISLDGSVEFGTMDGHMPAVARLNTEYIYWGTYSYSGMIHRYSCFGSLPDAMMWGENKDVQTEHPMIEFYQGDLDEFVSWSDPAISTDAAFREIAGWMWNSGNGLFFPGKIGAMSQSYVPSVGDTGVVAGGIFLPTAVTLANALQKGSVSDTDDPNQTTDDPVGSPLDDPYNSSHGTAMIDAWKGDIRFVHHGEELPLNYKCTHKVVKEGSDSAPYLKEETVLHNLRVTDVELHYVEGDGNSRVWCGVASVTTTETKYDPDSGTFVQETKEHKLADVVLSYDAAAEAWTIVISQTELEKVQVPVSIDPETQEVSYTFQQCSGEIRLTGELPVSDRWTGNRWESGNSELPSEVTGDFTTYMMQK